MMDSQENALNQGAIDETQVNAELQAEATPTVENTPAAETLSEETTETLSEETAETTDAAAPAETSEPAPTKTYSNKQEVLARVQELAHSEETPQKDEVELLKSLFYKMHLAEREAKVKEFLESGGAPEQFVLVNDESEETFKANMQLIREKRAKIFLEQEAEKQANLAHKLEIIEKIKSMATSPEEANQSYQEFKALQQEWKEIKAVPADKANELWRNYQLYVEQFYDLLKLNGEAREYDFKKNLEAKTLLCEAAEKLADEADVVSASRQLQELHQQYREIGPVAKDLREQIWVRFKNASTVINKKHQQYFEDLRAREEENLALKTALCEKAEAFAAENHKLATEWEQATKEVIALQAEWKKVGFAPQKVNVKIFERFRVANDTFFNKKAEFFKQLKQTYAANLEKKQALVDKAKTLSGSTEWRKTGDALVALQKEWKTIGAVPRKMADQLWKEFNEACNTFFEARNKVNAGARSTEHANLEQKKAVVEHLKALLEEGAENVQQEMQKLIEEYKTIGHVPFKEKDAIYNEYHDVIDQLYKRLHNSNAKRHLDNFKSSLKNVAEKGVGALDSERGRLMRRYDQLRSEVNTYENNLGFLNAASKKGNSLLEEMNRKVQKLKDDMELVKQKIKAIDAQGKA